MIAKVRDSLLEAIKNTWPMAVVIISFSFWFGGLVTSRMESPREKQQRIDRALAPITAKLDRLQLKLESHKAISGHDVMVERVNFLQTQVVAARNEAAKLEQEFTRDFVRKDELGNYGLNR